MPTTLKHSSFKQGSKESFVQITFLYISHSWAQFQITAHPAHPPPHTDTPMIQCLGPMICHQASGSNLPTGGMAISANRWKGKVTASNIVCAVWSYLWWHFISRAVTMFSMIGCVSLCPAVALIMPHMLGLKHTHPIKLKRRSYQLAAGTACFSYHLDQLDICFSSKQLAVYSPHYHYLCPSSLNDIAWHYITPKDLLPAKPPVLWQLFHNLVPQSMAMYALDVIEPLYSRLLMVELVWHCYQWTATTDRPGHHYTEAGLIKI